MAPVTPLRADAGVAQPPPGLGLSSPPQMPAGGGGGFRGGYWGTVDIRGGVDIGMDIVYREVIVMGVVAIELQQTLRYQCAL